MINKLSCIGNESQLDHCQHNGFDFKYCSPNRRLYITCDEEVGTVKLAEPMSDDHRISGVPMIELDGGIVAEFCADTFTENTGLVICRSLKPTYLNLTVTYTSEIEEEDFILATFNCFGNEERIFQCDQVNTTCVSGERVMIFCTDYIEDTRSTLLLTSTNMILLISSIIIVFLIVTIVTVICLFCRYRTTTNRKINLTQFNASRSNIELMRTMETHIGTNISQARHGHNRIVNSNAVNHTVEHEFNYPDVNGFGNENENVVPNQPHSEDSVCISPVSPILNYMVTTGSMPIFDENMSISFLEEYCGKDITRYVIPTSRLKIGSKLGEGAFGIVYKGTILDRTEEQMNQVEPRNEIAIKTLKNNYTDQELKNLLIECALLKDLQHPNILGKLRMLILAYNIMPLICQPILSRG